MYYYNNQQRYQRYGCNMYGFEIKDSLMLILKWGLTGRVG